MTIATYGYGASLASGTPVYTDRDVYLRFKNIIYELRERFREFYLLASEDDYLTEEDQPIELLQFKFEDVYIGKIPDPKPTHHFVVIGIDRFAPQFKRMGRRADHTLFFNVKVFLRLPDDIIHMSRIRVYSAIYENLTSTTKKITLGGNITEIRLPTVEFNSVVSDGWGSFDLAVEADANIV